MITKAKPGEERILAELAGKMWGSHTLEDLTQEFRQLLAEPEAALFLDWQGTTPVGFAQCQLRRDYVEGTASSPVGYLEGIFVEEASTGGRGGQLSYWQCVSNGPGNRAAVSLPATVSWETLPVWRSIWLWAFRRPTGLSVSQNL